MNRRTLCLIGFGLTACGGTDGVGVGGASPSPSDSLFEAAPGAKVTADNVLGLWGGRSPFDDAVDTRWRVGKNTLHIGARCASSVTVGVEVTARLDDSRLAPLESKSDVKKRADGTDCAVRITPVELRYVVEGTRLRLTDDSGTTISLVKISD